MKETNPVIVKTENTSENRSPSLDNKNEKVISRAKFSFPTDNENPLFPRQSYNLVKERHSDDALIIKLVQNKIVFNEGQIVKVTSSVDPLALEKWKVESELAVLKALESTKFIPQIIDSTIYDYASEVKSHQRRVTVEFLNKRKIANTNKIVLESGKCVEFLNQVEAANVCIENNITNAKKHLMKYLSKKSDPEEKIMLKKPLLRVDFPWTSIKHFTIEKGLQMINRYILICGIFEEDWKCTIRHHGSQSDAVSDHYFYEANFSLPCKMYPVAQATASLYFQMEVSRVIPTQCPIKVKLTLEGTRLKIAPEKFILKDCLFLRVIETKLKYFRECKF